LPANLEKGLETLLELPNSELEDHLNKINGLFKLYQNFFGGSEMASGDGISNHVSATL